MRKVTKILGKVLSAAVLLLIVLPLALSLLLSINAVQNFVVDRAAQFASRKLETVVRIDRVDIGIFDRITLEGDRKSTRLNSSHRSQSRMPSSA